MGEVIEGIETAKEVVRIAKEHKLKLPLFETIAAVLRGELTAIQAVERLMNLNLESELFLD